MKRSIDLASRSIEEKVTITRKYREEQYEKLFDAVYMCRGWNPNSVPTIEHLKNIRIDLPELIEAVKDL